MKTKPDHVNLSIFYICIFILSKSFKLFLKIGGQLMQCMLHSGWAKHCWLAGWLAGRLQWLAGYLGLTLSCGIAHSRKSLISIFQEFSASANEAFISVGGLGARLSFYEV